MNDVKSLYTSYTSMCVYDFKDEVLDAMADMLGHLNSEKLLKKWAAFFKAMCNKECAQNLSAYVESLVLTNKNCFTKACAADKACQLSGNITDAVKRDLSIMEAMAYLTPEQVISCVKDEKMLEAVKSMPKWETGSASKVLELRWKDKTEKLKEYHLRHGYGDYAKYRAFSWRGGKLCPITSADAITVGDLKSYEKQRQKVIDNTESFVMGLPANNVLLYGDRGTGKSSTVHAVLNMFCHSGLRMIEMPKAEIPSFPFLLEKLVGSPMKFIIFIDDLSFSSDDDSYAQLKAALEGSVSAKQSNTLIYATSNRRHLIKETVSQRDGDELHRMDSIQETMSLSDRFGLSVTFVNPDKNRFFEIIDKITADRNLDINPERLHAGAERWALERGGRSPRAAKQYIDLVESKVKRGLEWQ